jgi:hypothetical protein
VTFKGFGGVRNTVPPERLAPEDLTQAVNVDIDDSGRATRRIGTTKRVDGVAHSLWAERGMCLYMTGSSLMRLLPDFTSEPMAIGLTPDLPTNYVLANDRVYWTNSRQSGVIVNGANRRWGMPTPGDPALEPINGYMTPGQYQVVITHVREDGVESGAGMGVTINLLETGGVRVRWNVPPNPTITRTVVYLTEPNGRQLYQAAIADPRAGQVDITSINLAVPLNTQWLDQPPPGQCLAHHRGRIYIAAGAVLYATVALGYEHCDLRDYLAIDDSVITFVASVEHGLFVGTEKQVVFLAGDRLEDMTLRVVSDSPGIARSAVQADGYAVTGNAGLGGMQVVLFTTGSGVYQGNPDGSVVQLTHERYEFGTKGRAAATFRDGELLHQYLLFMSA